MDSTRTTPTESRTTLDRKSERELVITRTINGPARLVYKAWTTAELFKQWWVPKSFGLTLLSCEWDVRVGGEYRLVFRQGDSEVPFFGKFVEVTPHSRLAWTNDEGGEGGPITTVTFEEQGGKTRIVLHELYSSKEALEAALASGEKSGLDETFDQLEQILTTLGANSRQG
jgi:uncharacterized protein YndB with AHSA1/START domain